MAGWPVGKTLAVLQHTQGGSLCRSFAYGELSTMVWPPLEGRPWASKSFWAAKFADGFSPWCFVISHDMPNMFTVHSPQKHRWCWVGAKQCILCTPGSDVPSHLCGPFDHQSFNQGIAKRLLVQVFAVACVQKRSPGYFKSQQIENVQCNLEGGSHTQDKTCETSRLEFVRSVKSFVWNQFQR